MAYYYILVSVITILSGIAIVLFSMRYYKTKHQIKHLYQKVKIDKNSLKKLKDEYGITEVGTAGVALIDVLYNLGKVDPLAIAGINHLHHQQGFESLGDLTTWLNKEIIVSGKGSEAWKDMINKYKGYTGEENVFERIGEKTSITIPKSGTNEDWDFINNQTGQHYDVKIGNADTVNKGLRESPDNVHIWTNKENATAFKDHPRVHIDESLSGSDMYDMTYDTFSGIDAMGDLISGVPLATLAISSYRNYNLVKSGKKDKKIATQDILLDTAGVGVGGMLGSAVGVRLGQFLTPVIGPLSMIIIPTISSILGSIIGIMAGKGIMNWIRERHLRSAQKELKTELVSFTETFNKEYKRLIFNIKSDLESDNKKYSFMRKENQNIFTRYFWPDTLTAICDLAAKKIKEEYNMTRDYYNNLKQELKKYKSKEEAGLVLYAQGRNIYSSDPALDNIWDSVDNKLTKFEDELKKRKEKA